MPMIKDKKVCKPYLIPSSCEGCICNLCFNHIPFGDCALGFSLCMENCEQCEPVCVCSGFSAGSLAKSVQALQ